MLAKVPEGSNTRAFYRRLRAIDAEFSTAYIKNATIQDATITNATIVDADIDSLSFDKITSGDNPNDLQISGSLELLSGGVFKTGDSGEYIEINGATGQITFASAATEEVNPGLISADNIGTTYSYISMRSGILGDGILGTNYGYGLIQPYSDESQTKGGIYLAGIGQGSWDSEAQVQASTTTGDASLFLSALSTSGDVEIILNAQTSSGASYLLAQADQIDLSGPVGMTAPLTIDENGDAIYLDNSLATQPNGAVRFKQESNGAYRVGFYNGGWKDGHYITDASQTFFVGGQNKLSIYTGKGGESYLPFSTGDVYITSDDDEQIYFRDWNGSTYTIRAAITQYDDFVVAGALRAGSTATSTLTNGYIYASPGTTGSAANATWVLASGSTYYIQRSTSRRKYKRQIDYDIIDRLAAYEIKPTHHWRIDDERYRYGLIYEDLREVDPLLVDEEQPDWNAIVAVLAAKIMKLEERVKELESC